MTLQPQTFHPFTDEILPCRGRWEEVPCSMVVVAFDGPVQWSHSYPLQVPTSMVNGPRRTQMILTYARLKLKIGEPVSLPFPKRASRPECVLTEPGLAFEG